MNSGQSDPQGNSPDDSREKWITIDRLCDAYEASLQEGDVERAPFLAGVPRDWREQLTQELDAIDAAYRDAEETRDQTVKVPASDVNSRRLPTKGRLAELATLDRDKVWLGRFEIRKRLGTGATGSVWCARDARLARWVALKVPHATRVMSETSAARFQTEARAAAAITHPNVVQVHEVLIEDGLPILIQQWIDGPSLAKYLKDNGPLDFDQAADWLAQIADAVACAHEHGIVHRDLKPANVMLNKNRPMVLDFGLASYPQFSSGLTTEGTVLGTPAYMSPEQAEGAENSNQPPTDIYALGTILYEMLVGTPPFVGKAREVLQANKTAIPNPPRNRRSAIPRDLETITLRCLAKSPAARYRSAADLRDDLKRFIRREPIQARKVSLVENVWVWARFHPAYALLAAGIPLVMVLMIGILFSQMRQSQLSDRANRLVRENRRSEIERQTLLVQRRMVELSRASQELSEGDRTRGLELLRSIPESERQWEWKLLDLISHSPSRVLNEDVPGIEGTASITSLAVSRKHQRMIAATGNGFLVEWKLPTDREFFSKAKPVDLGKARVLFRSAASIQEIVVSPDERWLCWVDREGAVTIWDLEENERSQRVVLPKLKRGLAVAFSPDSKRIAVGGGSVQNNERPIDANSWLVMLQLNERGEFAKVKDRRWIDRPAITSLQFVDERQFVSTRGRTEAPLGSMGYVETWRCDDASFNIDGLLWRGLSMRGLDFHTASNRIAWCDDGGMAYVKDLRQPLIDPPRQFQASRRPATRVRFSPDGQEIVVTGNDGYVSRWSVATANASADATESDASSQVASDSAESESTTSADAAIQSPPDDVDAVPTVPPPPIRHIRDYWGHEHAVHDVVYLAPCRDIGGKTKPGGTSFQFCEPFLVTAGEDGKVIWWSNAGHDAIGTLNIGDRTLIDATWLSSRQLAVTTSAGKRQRPLYFRSLSLKNHGLSIDMRRVRFGKGIGTSPRGSGQNARGLNDQNARGLNDQNARGLNDQNARGLNDQNARGLNEQNGHVEDWQPTESRPPRFAVVTRTNIFVFESGNSEILATRSVEIEKRAGLNAIGMIDPFHVVAGYSHEVKLSKEAVKENPKGRGTAREECLLLYDLRSQSPPEKLVLPDVGAISCLLTSPTGDRVIGGTRSGKVFFAMLVPTDDGGWRWATSPVETWTAHARTVNDLVILSPERGFATVGDDGSCAIWSPSVLADSLENEHLTSHLLPSGNLTGRAETPIDIGGPDAEPLSSGREDSGQRFLVGGSPVTHVTASSSGDRIVTVGADRVIRIWATDSGLELISLQPRKGSVRAIEFSPDDRFLMIAESDSRIEVIRLLD